MENKSHAIAAGLFALLLGVASLLALAWLRDRQDNMRDFVIVTRQSVGGLNPQAQVRYRGIRVGKVTDIRLDPDDSDNILVSIMVRDDIPLTRGTVAKLAYQGVTGIAQVMLIETGKSREPLVPGSGTANRIVMVPSLLEELNETGTAALREAQEVLKEVAAVLDEDNRKRFAATLANLESVSASMKPTVENLNGTLVQMRKLLDDRNVGNISRAAGELAPLLADTRVLIGKMQVATDKLDVAVGDISGPDLVAVVQLIEQADALLGRNQCNPSTSSKGADRAEAIYLINQLTLFNQKYGG